MARHGKTPPWLAPVLLLLLLLNAGCSGTNLGDIDESTKPRDDMPGPGIFSDDEGETKLKWSSDSKKAEAEPELAKSSPDSTMSPEQAEFEQFKAWNELKANGAESAEYQEFLQWQEYQKFKASQ